MDQLNNTQRIVNEIIDELPQVISQIHNENDINKVRELTEKLIAYITVLCMLINDLIDPRMHASFWPNH